jgi:beta-lactam-binding protein with PASTA domain
VPAGSIIGLDPATPPQLPKDDPVNVIVSDGPEPRTVPAIPPTSTFDQAAAAIKAVQLAPARRDDFSDTVPEGQIIGTDPPAGTAVARDSTVTIIVSKGLPRIPEVKGQSVKDAAAQLQAAGFTVSGVQGDPARTVTGTNPPAGTPAKSGTGVTIITRN